MLILFDQAVPVPMRSHLKGHLVRTAAQQGWSQLKNGDLLKVAEDAGFDVLLTTDRNIRYQQNMEGRRIAVMALTCQQWPELEPYVQVVIEELGSIRPGTFIEVKIPPDNQESA
jgi:hypothetical protein